MTDDWFWGSEDGIVNFISGSQNTRYAGNMIELVLTRSSVIKTLFMAVVYVFFCNIMTVFITFHTKSEYHDVVFVTTHILLMSIHPFVWTQSIGNIACFSNYVTSMVCMTGVCLLLDKYYKDELSLSLSKSIMLAFYLCISMLFIENISVTIMGMMFAVSIYMLFIRKKISKEIICMDIGCLIGFILMMWSGLYTELFSTGTIEHLDMADRKFVFDMTDSIGMKMMKVIDRSIVVLANTFTIYNKNLFIAGFVLLLSYVFISVMKSAVIDKKSCIRTGIIIAYRTLMPLSVFFAVQVYGPRCQFHSYVMFGLYIIILLFRVIDMLSDKVFYDKMCGILKYSTYVIAAVFCVYFIRMYAIIGDTYRQWTSVLTDMTTDVKLLPLVADINTDYVWNDVMTHSRHLWIDKFYGFDGTDTEYVLCDKRGRFSIRYDDTEEMTYVYHIDDYSDDDIISIADKEYGIDLMSDEYEHIEFVVTDMYQFTENT